MLEKQEKIFIKQAVVVEGKCDRAVLESVLDNSVVIIPVNGFGIYRDKKKLELIRRYAKAEKSGGIILLTDSDNAGRQIRDYLKSYLKNCLNDCEIHHIYVPNLQEVEDTDVRYLRKVFEQFSENKAADSPPLITRENLFDNGFIGGENSAIKRKKLLSAMNLPENLSVTAMLDVINKCGLDYERFIKNC